MAMRTRYFRMYVGIIAFLTFHVQKDSGIALYYVDGLRIIHTLNKNKPNQNEENNRRGYGSDVSCYSCSSKIQESCAKLDTSKFKPVHCDRKQMDEMKNYAKNISSIYERIFEVDQGLVGVDLVCLKLEFLDGNKKYVLRGCQLGLHDHLDICRKVEEKNTAMIQKVHCSKCSTPHGCNSATTLYTGFQAALTLLCLVAFRVLPGF